MDPEQNRIDVDLIKEVATAVQARQLDSEKPVKFSKISLAMMAEFANRFVLDACLRSISDTSIDTTNTVDIENLESVVTLLYFDYR